MKNKTFFTIVSGLIVTGVVLAAIQFSANPASAYLSQEEAEQKVASKFSGEVMEFELDDNEKIYEVEIEGADLEYELKVDAETGEVINIEEEALREDMKQITNSNSEKEVTTVSLPDNQQNSRDDDKGEIKNQASSLLSIEEAKTIATEMYSGTVKGIELDEDDGNYNYELEIITEKAEVELEINAKSGEIVYISVDEDEAEAKQKRSSDNMKSKISTDEARSIALDKYSGTIKELELDEDDGRHIYEIEIRTDKGEVELEIDARTGEIHKLDYDD
ncbi:PepSY domain-containing protein [Gracilibacillus salitolerans]|nr:PepSY domain-containing protein [Gracilibacillus salitolerans]